MKQLSLYLLVLIACHVCLQQAIAHENTAPALLSTDRVFYRFYLLQRLKPAVDLFLKIVNEKSLHDTGSLELICSFKDTQIELFVHPLVQKNVLYLCAHNDSKALIRLIETLNQYRYIHDDAYVKEVVMLLLIVYENIVFNLIPTKKIHLSKTAIEQIASTHDQITTAPLNTLLHTLDTVCDELEQLYVSQPTADYSYWKLFATLVTLVGTTTCFWYGVQS